MATEIKVPKLGMAMREATVMKWLVDDGARVEQGQPIVEIESEKITYQVEAPASGVLHRAVEAGEVRPVAALIGYITAEGEPVPQSAAAPVGEPLATISGGVAEAPPTIRAPEAEFVRASPAARRLAREHGVNLAQVKGTGPDGRVVESDVRAFLDALKAPRVSPVAQRLAEELGVDLTRVTGTGPQGRITREDVERAARQASPPAAEVGPPSTIPFTGMRRTIARNMVESLQTMAQVTLFAEADVTELVRLRERLRRDFDLTYTDLIIQAVARALEKHPRLNASLDGDQIRLHDEIHIGMAVALEEGLIVPVIRNANRKTLREIARETKDLAARARQGTISIDEVTGSTFSVTNLGSRGIDGFTPIINPPEVAILGVGRIVEKPAAYQGTIALRHLVVLSLTHDHRLVDGAPAADFLRTVVELLELPYLLAAG